MTVPTPIAERLARLSAECGTELKVVSHWANEFRPGWYCRFRGTVLASELLVIELAGTLAIELQEDKSDEVDLFVFVNGRRVSIQPARQPSEPSGKYLWRRGTAPLTWDCLDDGYDSFQTLDDDKWRLPGG
jgi:hypothetical protein